MRYTPAGLDVDALHGQTPPVTDIARTTVAAVLQSGGSGNACSALGSFERIRQGCRAVLVGGGRFYLLNTCARVGCFKLADARGYVVLRLGILRHFDDTIDDVGKVRGLGHDKFFIFVQSLMPQHHPLGF